MNSKPNIRNRYVFIGDLALIIVSILGSFILRLELGAAFFQYLPMAMWMILVSLILKPLVYYFNYFLLRHRSINFIEGGEGLGNISIPLTLIQSTPANKTTLI